MKGDVIRFDRGKDNADARRASSIDEREEATLVGRERERALFQQFLTGASEGKQVWSLYGTGGVGKSTLLDALRRQARKHGAAFHLLDSRDFARSGEALCRRLLEQMNVPEPAAPVNDSPVEAVLRELHRMAQAHRVIVAIDTFEEMSSMEAWLREDFLRRLYPEVLVILAGRYPLKGPWLITPAWRERTRWLPIGHLKREDVLHYAKQCGITGEDQGERLWERTQGHGLSLALAVSAELLGEGGPMESTGWSSELADLWLKEVPDEELRALVEAASMLRSFNQELLEYIMEQEASTHVFTRLTQLSFVRPCGKGWALHDLMSDSTRGALRVRTPSRYNKLLGRCVLYYASIIREAYRKRDMSAEVGELFYYIGDQTIRAFLNISEREEYVWEPLTRANLEEGLHYLERRRAQAMPVTRRGVDPATGELLEETLTEEQMLFTIAGLELEELLALEKKAVMLMKSPDGTVCGLSAIIPIHSSTMAYLEHNSFSGPYIRSLTPEERKALSVTGLEPSGWFIKSIDILDWNQSAMLLEGASQMYAYMCSGKLFFTTPPPLEMFQQSHLGLGFELVPDVYHCSYDGKTPTPTFVLDTRGDKLEAFLAKMLRRVGLELEPAEGTTAAHNAGAEKNSKAQEREYPFDKLGLTEREPEVALLVLEGCSNADIAARLFVTEITVKKHLSSIYAKMQVKNRSQLIKAMLQ
jgi:DNA-binding CsgD family transcriptional regulator